MNVQRSTSTVQPPTPEDPRRSPHATLAAAALRFPTEGRRQSRRLPRSKRSLAPSESDEPRRGTPYDGRIEVLFWVWLCPGPSRRGREQVGTAQGFLRQIE